MIETFSIETLLSRFFKSQRIGPPGYMRRWFLLILGPLTEVYLHRFNGGDQARDSHCHPWLLNITIVLRGLYVEEIPLAGGDTERKVRQAGRVYFRFGKAEHRIPDAEPGTWTLFLGLIRWRDWGFYEGSTGRFIPNDQYKG